MATSTTDIPTPTTSSAASPSCTTAVPDHYGHVPFDACNSNYNDNPSFEGNLAFAALFGASFVTHIVQAVVYKKVRQQALHPPHPLCEGRKRKSNAKAISGSAGWSLWAPPGRRPRLACAPWEPITSRRCSTRSGDSSSSYSPLCVSEKTSTDVQPAC